VSEKEINKVIFTPHVYLVKITIDGTEHTAIIKETQFHPVKDNVLHVDFYEVNPNKPIVIGVPIQTEGLAAGVRAGGRLTTMLRKLNVRGLYTNIPEKLVIDVTPLELGKSMKVGELSFDNIELVTPKEVVVCTIKMTRAARSAADAQQNA
ncbi:MAG: 50S ribosomal protein L25, partial [Bacteroidaceae bacterium]|nr:50S ribosomal protein L25 [Bacteroidaceae bacterium]